MTARARVRAWCLAVGVWSVVFAAPHFYWAAGGRAGLGSQAAAADAALAQTWFAAYNLAAGVLGVAGALLAAALAQRWAGPRVRRWLLAAAILAGAVLLARGVIGTALLAVDQGGDLSGGQIPPILLAIEPWFILGGLAYAQMARTQRRAGGPADTSEPAALHLRR